jgi:hypothetical protein
MNRRSLLLASLVALSAVGASALSFPSGDLRNTGAADLLLNKRKPRYYNEIWSWQIALDDGSQVSLNFTYARLGFKDPVCGADIAVANFKGRNYAVGREYPEDRLQQAGNPLRVQIHPDIWFQGLPPAGMHLHFATTKNEGYYLDLAFSDIKQGVAWGNGVFGMKEGDLGITVPIPMARVSGKLAIGGDTVQVQGWAVMEHMRQTALLGDLVDETFRGFRTGPDPVYMNVFKEKDRGWTGFVVEWKDGRPVLHSPAAVSVGSGGGVNPPVRVDFASVQGGHFSMERKSFLQGNSILDGMEGVTRTVVKMFVGDVRLARGRTTDGFYQYVKIKR